MRNLLLSLPKRLPSFRAKFNQGARMQRLITTVCTVAIAVGMSFAGAVPASAGTEYRDGGTWYTRYEKEVILESNYHHPTRTHRSSVTTPHEVVRSAWKGAGIWSYANTYPNPSGGNRCNYALA